MTFIGTYSIRPGCQQEAAGRFLSGKAQPPNGYFGGRPFAPKRVDDGLITAAGQFAHTLQSAHG
jgi:hypothetical protein